MPSRVLLLAVKIDARLAAEYWVAYERAFGGREGKGQPLADFIAAFVEDRLREEIEFAEREAPRRFK